MDQLNKHSEPTLSLAAIYERYRCPAEIIMPYRIPGADKSLLATWDESRFKKSLGNMDFPWILVMATTGVGTAVTALVFFITRYYFSSSSIAVTAAMGVLGCFPIVFMLSSPFFYPLFVMVNMRLGWGKTQWVRTLLGPTHVGITDSGFKLYVRGWFFYNYPNLAIWQEVFNVDLVADLLYDTITLRFVYQTGFGRAPIDLPLSGFATAEDLEFVLRNFAEHVDPENQGAFLRKMSEVDFAPILAAYKEDTLADLGIYHRARTASAVTFGEAMKQSLRFLTLTENVRSLGLDKTQQECTPDPDLEELEGELFLKDLGASSSEEASENSSIEVIEKTPSPEDVTEKS